MESYAVFYERLVSVTRSGAAENDPPEYTNVTNRVHAILEVMQKQGYVGEFEVIDDHRSADPRARP